MSEDEIELRPEDTNSPPEDRVIDVRSYHGRKVVTDPDDPGSVFGVIEGDPMSDDEVTVRLPVKPGNTISTKDRQVRAASLRLAGASYRRIAEKLGYADASAARKAVHRIMDKYVLDSAEELREIHHARLETLLSVVWDEALGGEYKALDRALSVMDRLEKLHGLAAPSSSTQTVEHVQKVQIARGNSDEYVAALEAAARSHQEDHQG